MGPYQHLGEDDEDEEPPSDNLGGSSATNGTSERPNPSGAILEPEKELPAWKLLLTSLSLFGVQVVWTVELAFGTPYLLSLGVPKPLISIVWLAGPLSGLIVQPIVGSYSDEATFRMGRRRPFVIGGSAIVAVSLLILAYAYQTSRFFIAGLSEPDDGQKAAIAQLTRWTAVFAFWLLDFSLNAVMATSRALIMDIAPVEQQGVASAFAGRQISLGNVAGYVLGFLNLPQVFPLLGDSQVTVLCLLALFILVICVGTTCLSTKEERHVDSGHHKRWFDPLVGIFSAFVGLPKELQDICNVLFFAWVGWFGFLFFSSSWVAEITHGPIGLAPHIPPATNQTSEVRFLWERTLLTLVRRQEDNGTMPPLPVYPGDQGARAGSFALFVFALVSLAGSIIVPPLAQRTNDSRSFAESLPSVSRMWAYSIAMFSIVSLSTIFVSDLVGATICVALLGIPWATAVWAPYVLIGEYCRQELDQQKQEEAEAREEDADGNAEGDGDVFSGGPVSDEDRLAIPSSTLDDGNFAPSILSEHSMEPGQRGDRRRLDVGTVMGISNLYVVIPQLVMTGLSSLIFAVFHSWESGGDKEEQGGSDAFGWVLRIGGIFAIGAAYLAFKLSR